MTAGAASVLRLAAWFGLLTGFVEVAVLAAKKLLFAEILFMGLDAAWMIPVADLLFFLIVGLAWSGLTRFWPKIFPPHGAIFVFAFLAAFSVLFMFAPRLHKYAAMILACGIAVQAHHGLVRAGDRFDPVRRRTFRAMIAALGALAVGIPARKRLAERAAVRRLPAASPAAPNVLLIVMDTVRSRNLGLHGYSRATSPQLERWSAAGVWFEQAFATSPWTLPSHASMFTGRFPHELSANWLAPLDGAYPTLAEFYRSKGYLTAGFVSNTGYCSAEFGLNRGFDHYDDYSVSVGQMVSDASLGRYVTTSRRLRRLVGNHQILGRKSADETTAGFLEWLSGLSGRPFFAFLNYYDAHAPYIPPPPFDSRFGRNRIVESKPWARRKDVPADELRAMIDNYDASIAYVDHHLGLILDALRERGLENNTLVVITSDHGEEFGEHGFFDHGNTLYLASVAVPLVMSYPAGIPVATRVSAPISLRDLACTVAEVSHGAESGKFPGTPLSRVWRDASLTAPTDDAILCAVRAAPNVPPWLPVHRGDMYALARGNWRYIRNGDGREELFDIEHDANELHDLSASRDLSGVLLSMRAALEAALAS